MSFRLPGGYYDETGKWIRTKYCFVACEDCSCMPPNGLWYVPGSPAEEAFIKEIKSQLKNCKKENRK